MKYFVGTLIIAGLLALPFTCGKYDVLYNRTVGTEVDYIESEIRVSQNKLPKRLCESWSLPAGY